MSDLMRQSAKLSARLNAIPQEVVQHLRPALIKAAENTAGVMRALVPVDDGDLRDSIEVTQPGGITPRYAASGGQRVAGENQALVTAGNPDVRHGHLQEFGTVDHPAQPFLRPAERLTRDQNRRRIGRAVGQAIRKAGV